MIYVLLQEALHGVDVSTVLIRVLLSTVMAIAGFTLDAMGKDVPVRRMWTC